MNPGKPQPPLRKLPQAFLRGLVVVLPTLLTAYLLWGLAAAAEGSLGRLLRRLLPESMYVRGLGIVVAIALVVLIGSLTRLWLARRLIELFESMIDRIPLVKTVYGSIKDLMGFFSGNAKGELGQVVLVRFEQPAMHMLGFVTREDLTSTSPELADDQVAVYLPMSYQIGGFTVMVPRSTVSPIAMSVEEAMRFAMTAGVSSSTPPPESAPDTPS